MFAVEASSFTMEEEGMTVGREKRKKGNEKKLEQV
jgi:hypothetical protein